MALPIANGASIVIVGGGLSGTLCALHVKAARPDLNVQIIERSKRLGPGLAYGKCSDEHLLNVPVSRLDTRTSVSFSEWLAGHPEFHSPLADALAEAGGRLEDAFVQRYLFGAYLEEQAEALIASGQLTRKRGEAVAFLDASQRGVLLEDGRQISADAVILALGNLPPKSPADAEIGLEDLRGYVADPWARAAQDRGLEWRRQTVSDLKAHFNRANLTPAGRLSYDLWVDQYERAADAARFRRNDFGVTQQLGPQASRAQFLISAHRVSEPSDMDAYIARIGGASHAIGQLLERAKLNAAVGTRPPAFAYEGVIQQARAQIAGAPFNGEGDSPLWADAKTKIDALFTAGKIDQARADALKQGARSALLGQWRPAYQGLVAWLEADAARADTIATGVVKKHNGQA